MFKMILVNIAYTCGFRVKEVPVKEPIQGETQWGFTHGGTFGRQERLGSAQELPENVPRTALG